MNNDNTKVITELEEKNKALVEKLKILTAENAGNLARQAKLENRCQYYYYITASHPKFKI